MWNNRHQISPSNFNLNNSKHYKQYFDKEFRNRDKILLPVKREMDPYEANEVKGTRMPKYTKVDKQRDIYGELAWDKHHSVKTSKFNDNLYPTCREFFDGPRNYNRRFNTTDMQSSDFYRKQAPKNSVGKIHRPPRLRSLYSKSPHSMSNFFGGSSTSKVFKEKRSGSITNKHILDEMERHGSFYDTPFVLPKEPGNKFAVVDEVKNTMNEAFEIPFLRT